MNTHVNYLKRKKFPCFIYNCEKSFLYTCTLKKHIIHNHAEEYNKLMQEYPSQNFYDIFKDIPSNRKLNFVNFEVFGSTNEDSNNKNELNFNELNENYNYMCSNSNNQINMNEIESNEENSSNCEYNNNKENSNKNLGNFNFNNINNINNHQNLNLNEPITYKKGSIKSEDLNHVKSPNISNLNRFNSINNEFNSNKINPPNPNIYPNMFNSNNQEDTKEENKINILKNILSKHSENIDINNILPDLRHFSSTDFNEYINLFLIKEIASQKIIDLLLRNNQPDFYLKETLQKNNLYNSSIQRQLGESLLKKMSYFPNPETPNIQSALENMQNENEKYDSLINILFSKINESNNTHSNILNLMNNNNNLFDPNRTTSNNISNFFNAQRSFSELSAILNNNPNISRQLLIELINKK